MIRSAVAGDVNEARGRVREYGRRYLSGEIPDAFEAAYALLDFLLRITIFHPSTCLRWTKTANQPQNVRLLGVPKRGLQLRDGRFLDLTLMMQLDRDGELQKLRIYKARFQYQNDEAGKDWIFRYDYIRYPDNSHPASHIQLRGSLEADCLPGGLQLKDVHFPTGRMSVEAIIRCIVEQFGCDTAEPASFWRPVLAESEETFNRIAHKTISGPRA